MSQPVTEQRETELLLDIVRIAHRIVELLAVVRQYPDFPIVLETYRQALSDVFDLRALQELLRGITARRIRVHEVETRHASPFARSLVFAYVAAYIYEQDAPLAERKAQALTLDRNLLAELLGQAELRELIDPQVLAELEDERSADNGFRLRVSGRELARCLNAPPAMTRGGAPEVPILR